MITVCSCISMLPQQSVPVKTANGDDGCTVVEKIIIFKIVSVGRDDNRLQSAARPLIGETVFPEEGEILLGE